MSIKLYSTPTCHYCKVAKDYLKQKGVKFNEYNVASDRRRADEMMRKTRQMGVPVLDINGRIIVGFDKPKLDQLLS